SFVRVCAHTTFFLHFFPDPSPPFDKPTHSLPPFLSFSLSFCLTHKHTHFPFLFSPLPPSLSLSLPHSLTLARILLMSSLRSSSSLCALLSTGAGSTT